MARKIRKSPLALPLVNQISADQTGEAGEASALTSASERKNLRASWRSSLEIGDPCRGDSALLSESRVGQHIARELRSLYEPIVTEPPPDRFIELLNQLEAGSIYREKVRAPEPEE